MVSLRVSCVSLLCMFQTLPVERSQIKAGKPPKPRSDGNYGSTFTTRMCLHLFCSSLLSQSITFFRTGTTLSLHVCGLDLLVRTFKFTNSTQAMYMHRYVIPSVYNTNKYYGLVRYLDPSRRTSCLVFVLGIRTVPSLKSFLFPASK